jgi:hypothetical protein
MPGVPDEYAAKRSHDRRSSAGQHRRARALGSVPTNGSLDRSRRRSIPAGGVAPGVTYGEYASSSCLAIGAARHRSSTELSIRGALVFRSRVLLLNAATKRYHSGNRQTRSIRSLGTDTGQPSKVSFGRGPCCGTQDLPRSAYLRVWYGMPAIAGGAREAAIPSHTPQALIGDALSASLSLL